MPCNRLDCAYHTVMDKEIKPGCNYMFITGRSKLGQMTDGAKYDIEHCPFYQKKSRECLKRVAPTVTPNLNNTKKGVARIEQVENAVDYYDANLSDTDMAVMFGTTIQAVSAWRKKNALPLKKGPLTHINWTDVQAMFEEGYSLNAIAKYHNTKDFVIQRYFDLKAKGIRQDAI